MGLNLAKFCFGNSFNEYVKYEKPGAGGSIVDYDTDVVLDYLWIFGIPGSIFTRRIIFSCIFAVGSATGLANISCILHPNLEYCFPATTDFTGKVGWQNLTLLKFTGFVTVIFTVEIFKRWWAIRILLQGVFGKANSIVTTIAASFSVSLCKVEPDVAKDALEAQEQIYRYLNLAHSLMYKFCESGRNLDDLQRDDCATKAELDTLITMGDECSPDAVYGWITVLIHRLGKAGLLGDMHSLGKVNMKILLTDLEIIRHNNSMVLMYIHSQLPFCFLQLLTVVVYFFTIQAIIVAASIIAHGIKFQDYTAMATGYITLAAMTFVFMSLIEIYQLLHNPLGDDAADYPISSFQGSSSKGYKSLILMASELSYRKPKDFKSAVKPLIHFRVQDMRAS